MPPDDLYTHEDMLRLPQVGSIDYTDKNIQLDIRAEPLQDGRADHQPHAMYHFLLRFPSENALNEIEAKVFEEFPGKRFPNLVDERTVLAGSIGDSQTLERGLLAGSDAIEHTFGVGLDAKRIMPMIRQYKQSAGRGAL